MIFVHLCAVFITLCVCVCARARACVRACVFCSQCFTLHNIFVRVITGYNYHCLIMAYFCRTTSSHYD